MDHQQWLEQHDRMIADHDRDMAQIRETLRRAIRLAVQDGRRQRRRNAEFDEKMTQIASAQQENRQLMKENQQLLKAFLERGGNGSH